MVLTAEPPTVPSAAGRTPTDITRLTAGNQAAASGGRQARWSVALSSRIVVAAVAQGRTTNVCMQVILLNPLFPE